MPKDTSNSNGVVSSKVINQDGRDTEYGLGYRHVQSLLIFSVLVMGYIIRASMSVAIIAMSDMSNNTTMDETYEWDKKTQDIILSSFYWGYTVNQIPGGYLARRYGGKVLLLGAMFVNGILLVVMPLGISMGGWRVACAARMLQGLTQSPLMPSIHTLISKWIPVNERGRLGNLVIAGGSFGTLVGLPLTGYLVGNYGWVKMFQILGAMAMFTGVCWYFFGADRPSKHPKISIEERLFIETSIGPVHSHKVLKTPWRKFFTSGPVLALLIVHIGLNWCFLILFLETPSFLTMALGVDLKRSGLYSSLPYITMYIIGLLLSIASDYVISRKIFSVTFTRKSANTVAAWGYTFGLIILSYIPKEHVMLNVVCLTLTTGLSSGMIVGFMLNHIDLSPNFAGILMGITNCAANAIGVLAPISVGYILTDATDPSQWRIVFLTTAAIGFFTNLVFQIYGTSEKQWWNDPKEGRADIELAERNRTKLIQKQDN